MWNQGNWFVKKLPYFPLYVTDFLSSSKVDAMSTEAVGCYFLLLCRAWHENPPATLPTDDETLARWARLPLDRWMDVRKAVLAPFTSQNGRFLQRRLRDEYDRIARTRNAQSKGGSRGAATKWKHSTGADNGSPISHPLGNPQVTHRNQNQSQSQSQKEPDPKHPPTPRAGPPPGADAGRSERPSSIHPSTRFNQARRPCATVVEQIAGVYPDKAAIVQGKNATQDAITRIGRGDYGPVAQSIDDAAAWLLGRVRAYAASAEGRGGFFPRLAKWMDDGRFMDADEAWNRARVEAKDDRRSQKRAGEHEAQALMPKEL